MNGVKWVQRVDETDRRFVVVTMRIPNGGMPTATYSGEAAADRIRRFCHGFLQGGAGVTSKDAPLTAEEIEALRTLRRDAASMPSATAVRGWLFALAGVPDGEKTIFTLSARLFPVRSTDEGDWRALGACACALGAPAKPVTPIEETPPEATFVWRWSVETRRN